MDEGHCGLPAEELISLTQTLLEVPAELVETALGLEFEGGAVIADDLEGRRSVFLAGLYGAEREIAEKFKALAIGRPPWPAIDADKAIPWVEQRTKLALAVHKYCYPTTALCPHRSLTIDIIRSLSVVMMLDRYLQFAGAPELFIAGNWSGFGTV
jgi:hypothetical protein